MNFWRGLEKPIMALAPMDGVTDTVFRQIVCTVGKPDVLFTEFVPVDAILSSAQDKVIEKSLRFTDAERPIAAQIWGVDPEKFYKSARILKKLGFDGIDINMGCPVRDVVKTGSCAALIKNPALAKEIILATIKGAEGLPVSVKTRIGFSEIETEKWVTVLLQTPISALTLHLRTAAEMSKVPAHWEEISKAVGLNPRCLILGNGDIKTLKEAKDKCIKYGIDGVMIGTGIFENVWFFNEKIDIIKVTPKQKIKILIKHLNLFKKTWGNTRHFELMKKFVKCYINNFKGSSKARESLMETNSLDELIQATFSLLP